MRKLIAAALALCLTASMAACSGGSGETTAAASSAASSAAETTAEETTAAETTAAEETTQAAAADVMTYDEYVAAELETPVTIQAYVQAKQSYYAEQGTVTVYLQDQDGGYFAYDMACAEEDYDKLTEGTCIQVSGYKTEWSGEVEIADGTFTFVEDAEPFVAEPLDVTEYLGTDELETYQNQKVSFTGLTVEASTDANGNEAAFLYNYDGSGSQGDDVYFNVSYNGQTFSFLVESYLCDSSTEVYQAVEALEVGQTIDCEGFLYWYEGANPHITSLTVAE